MTKTRRQATATEQRRGASLVEVLVVLVIILVGVFSVIRIFPKGFGILQQAQNRTLATRLASQIMEQAKADEGNLPQGVLFTAFGDAIPPQNIDPDDLRMYDPNPDDDAEPQFNPYFSDVNKFRFIEAETVRIPLPTPTAYGTGSLYTVRFGPMFMDERVGNPEQVPTPAEQAKYLRVYGAPLRGIPDDSANLNARPPGPQAYRIDYGDDGQTAQIMFFPDRTKDRVFTVVFTFESNGTAVTRKITLAVPAQQAGQAVWQEIRDADVTYSNLYAGSDIVSREFARIAPNAPWDTEDPYQFKLLSNNIQVGTGGGVFANMGVLAFNPAGANYSQRTPFGQQAFTAFVDYSVLDWHILREEREVPTVQFDPERGIPIKLTLNNIKQRGDPESADTPGTDNIYQGLYRDATVPPEVIDEIQVFDLQGTAVDPADTSRLWPAGQPLQAADIDDAAEKPNAHVWIDFDDRSGSFRTGTVYINPQLVRTGSQLRILYKAEGDWAVAVQKAYASYERARGDNTNSPIPTSYNNYGQRDGETRLVFNRSDLNKSVVATVEYRRQDGSIQRTQPLQLTIDETDTLPGPGGQPQVYAVVDVGRYVPQIRNATGWYLTGPAVGVSFKVRVIWKDDASTSNAWRIQDLDTYLTRP